MSPRISARARERYKVAAVKDDRFDAFALADTLRFDHAHWRPLPVPSPLLTEIKAFTQDRDRLLETQQTIESQLRMLLEAYRPAPVRLFSSVDRQITLSFVTDYPTPANASRVKTPRKAGFLSRHHFTGRVPAQTLAERMRQNLLSGSPGRVAGKSFSALAFTQVLQLLNTQLAEFDDAIAAAHASPARPASHDPSGSAMPRTTGSGKRPSCGRSTRSSSRLGQRPRSVTPETSADTATTARSADSPPTGPACSGAAGATRNLTTTPHTDTPR